MAATVRFLSERGIPVCGHIGLMPQAVHVAGGFRATGRSQQDVERIIEDARAISDAGAFAVVIEAAVEKVAQMATEAIAAPTIGIGASPACDGQILVTDDVLGLFGTFTPRFVRRYAELGSLVSEAAANYAADVTARRFPGPEHCFGVKPGRS
jgi:3-methyl-2-oxobutanoate hydroxymethyltransferase